MPEQPVELQRINWSSCFAFPQIFRSFKMAIHPGKLGLALAAILLTGAWGWVLDRLWLERYQPMPAEVHAFWQRPDIDQWREQMKDPEGGLPAVVTTAYQRVGRPVPADIAKRLSTEPRAAVDAALKDLRDKYPEAVRNANEQQAIQIADAYNRAYRDVERVRNTGIFASFLRFETDAIRQFIDACASLRFTRQTREVLRARQEEGFMGDRPAMARGPADAFAGLYRPEETGAGALAGLLLMVRGVQWLVLEHPLFALLFLLGSMAVWALLGGAICRLAALNVARDERIPVRSALNFSGRKYVGFLTAPLLPIALIVAIGIVMLVGGLIGSIPGVGAILAGLGMGLALLGGFVMALVVIGGLGGGSLMWPTIAVEGSDSFDAMSRSYSYVYSRPWKAAFYALVAAVYGAICYLFARLFVYLMLRLTRAFVGLGMWLTSRPGTGTPGASRIDVIWPTPTFDQLIQSPPPFGARYDDTIGFYLTMIWVGLATLLLCAFLASFYLCASTIIYYLLRREVDATDMEDVYSEESDEELLPAGTTPPAPAAPTAAPETGTPETGTPPATA